MRIGILVGLGLGFAIASLSGCAPGADETNASPASDAAAPTPLVPEAYAAPPGPVASTASPPAPTMPRPPLIPIAATAPAPEGRVALVPATIFNPYRPHWIVDVH